MSPRYLGFKEETLAFLEELGANNNRDWFKENKPRYEDDSFSTSRFDS